MKNTIKKTLGTLWNLSTWVALFFSIAVIVAHIMMLLQNEKNIMLRQSLIVLMFLVLPLFALVVSNKIGVTLSGTTFPFNLILQCVEILISLIGMVAVLWTIPAWRSSVPFIGLCSFIIRIIDAILIMKIKPHQWGKH